LPVALTKGQFFIEGPGLGEPLKINVKEYVLICNLKPIEYFVNKYFNISGK
jgi:hypothetical protein